MTNPWTQPNAPDLDDLPELQFSRRDVLWHDLNYLLPDRREQVADQIDVLSVVLGWKIGLYVRRWFIPFVCARLCYRLCRDALRLDRKLRKALDAL